MDRPDGRDSSRTFPYRTEPREHMTGTIDILLVDDHQLVRDGLRLRLDAIDGFRVIGEASNMAEALDAIGPMEPHLVLTDLTMKGGSGVALTREIRQRRPGIYVLVL